MNFQVYKNDKNKLVEVLTQAEHLAIKLGMDGSGKELATSIKGLQDEKFQLVVVGEFSRGKSTFVNAMLGKKILPSSKKPTTAIITKIVYSPVPKYVLNYKNGAAPKEISEETFVNLIAPKETSLFSKVSNLVHKDQQKVLDSISYADVGYPLDFCKDNVDVVDTPGTNDLNIGRIEITYKYVAQADAVILVLAANQALTASELSFIKERVIGNQITDIFFVINYKDALGGIAAEEERVRQHVAQNLRERIPELPADLKIHMVSSLQALLYRQQAAGVPLKPKQLMHLPANFADTGFEEFEARLTGFLAEEKGRIKLHKYALRGENTLGKMQEDIAMRIELATKSADEIQEKIDKLQPEFEKARKSADKLFKQTKAHLRNKEMEISSECDLGFYRIKQEAEDAIDYYYGSYSGRDIKEHLERAVTRAQKNFINSISDLQRNILLDEIKEINKALKKIWEDVSIKYNSGHRSFASDADIVPFDLSFSTGENNNRQIGYGAIGAFIGGCVAGPVGAAIGAFIGLLCGSSSDNKESREDITERRKANLKRTLNIDFDSRSMAENILSQYRKQADAICDSYSKAVESRLKDMNGQLQAVLRDKAAKDKDVNAILDELHGYKKQIDAMVLQMKAY